MARKAAKNKEACDLLAWGSTQSAPDGSIELFKPQPTVVIEPFDYQQETLTKFQEWYAGPEPEALIALTVGLGKTITAALCAKLVLESGAQQKILWLTHREELLDQSKKDLESITGVACEIEKAERRASSYGRIIVASVQTLSGGRLDRLAKSFRPTLIICDEAHHALARGWMSIKTTFFDARVLNLTATPYRADVSSRLNLGEVLIEKNTTDGIRMKRLVPPKPVGKLELNLGKVKKRLGDFDSKSLSEVLCTDDVLAACVSLISQHYKGRRGIIFAATVEHGHLLSAALRKLDISVGEIYGDTPTEERRKYYKAIAEGKLDFLVNNLVLTEGFNLPALDLVVMLRPTKNAALYLQCLGRGLRTCEDTGKKECLVIDILDTAKRKGSVKGVILPTEDDKRKYDAMTGKPSVLANLFLRWFHPKEEVDQVIDGKLAQEKCAHIADGEQFYGLIFPNRGNNPWLPPQERAIALLNQLMVAPTSLEQDPDGYKALFTAIRCGNAEALIRLLSEAGWGYYPHDHLPTTKEEADKIDALAGSLEEVEESYDFSTMISKDASLKNFIIDIFGSESLEEQSKKYYEVHSVQEKPVVWYKPLHEEGFTFIEKDSTFLIRADDGQFYVVKGIKGDNHGHAFPSHIQPQQSRVIQLKDIPYWCTNMSWLSQPMSEAQANSVSRILKMGKDQLEEAKISKMSASALIASGNFFNKSFLKKIAVWLKQHHVPSPVQPAASTTPEQEALVAQAVTQPDAPYTSLAGKFKT